MGPLKIGAVEVEPSHLGLQTPARLTAVGNLDVLTMEKIGLMCSSQCPGSVVLRTYDCIRDLRDRGTVIAGGFHSPMERECLRILLRGRQPIVICPARSIDGMQLPDEWRDAFTSGRLLLLSMFRAGERRMTRELASRRNALVASISTRILVPHAAPTSNTLALCRELLEQGRLIETFDDPANSTILLAGGVPYRGAPLPIVSPAPACSR